MNIRMMRRVLALAISLMLVFACAASAATVLVEEGAVVYAKPDDEAKQYGALEADGLFEMTASGYGWAKLEAGGKVGYVKLDDVEKVKTYSGETVYVNGGCTMYGDIECISAAAELENGQAVKLYAIAGELAYIKAGGKSGIVKVGELSVDKPATGEKTPVTLTAYVSVDGAKAYKSASTDSRLLCTLNTNDTVTVTAVSNGWARVEKNGYSGYMKTAQLSLEKIDKVVVESFTAYAKNDGAKVYDKWNGSGSVVKTLKMNDTVKVTAYNSVWSRVEISGKAYFMYVADLSREKVNKIPDNGSTVMPATGTAISADWWTSDIQKLLPRGGIATITDVETGIAWQIKRTGGTNHADIQPLTAADTAAMKKVYGTWSWDRRAVFVTIDGVNYAASINGMPHGSGDSIPDNNFDGHHCLHFTNSRTHGTNKVCSLHQGAIKKALNATLR